MFFSYFQITHLLIFAAELTFLQIRESLRILRMNWAIQMECFPKEAKGK
jgi:hypothetical protein